MLTGLWDRVAQVMKVPEQKRPISSALAKLEREIAVQVRNNAAMESRSMRYALRGCIYPKGV